MEVPILGNARSKEIWTCLQLNAPGGTLLLIPVSVELESKFSTWGNKGHGSRCWFSVSS